MFPLLKVMAIIALVFASTFIFVNLTGIITIEKIKIWFELAKNSHLLIIAAIVIILLIIDLFIAVPTLTVIVLSGYFLGFGYGTIASLIGLSISGLIGYQLSYWYGNSLLDRLIKSELEKEKLTNSFFQHSSAFILLSRALPILPETCACLAGATKLPIRKFSTLWALSITPYVLVATYAGSISTLENPKPAIYSMLGLTCIFWLLWRLKFKQLKNKTIV